MTLLILHIITSVIMLTAIIAVIYFELAARKHQTPAVPTLPKMRKAMIKHLKAELQNSPATQPPAIIEMGSGWGGLALAAAKACPDAQIIGYEIVTLPLVIAKIRAYISRRKNLSFHKADIFTTDIRHADIILTYLTPPLMARLQSKLTNDPLKKNATLISSTFPLPDLHPREIQPVYKTFARNIYIFDLGDQST